MARALSIQSAHLCQENAEDQVAEDAIRDLEQGFRVEGGFRV